MAEAKRKESWDHTSHIMRTIAEVNRNEEQRSEPYHWKEFHPFYKNEDHSDVVWLGDDASMLAGFFPKREEVNKK